MSHQFRIVPYREHPSLVDQIANFETDAYPPYIDQDPVWADIAPHFYDEFANFQFFIVDDENDKMVGACNNVAFGWDGNAEHLPGYHQMLTKALVDWRNGTKPNTMSPVQVIIDPDYRGKGLPELAFDETARLTREHGMLCIMTAVRPTLKDKYPLVAIEDYAQWRREDGQLFDPWLRSIERMGAEPIATAPESTVIEGTIAQWEQWTDMKFPVSGEYWIPGGLSTLRIDRENNSGRHCEPHVWFRVATG